MLGSDYGDLARRGPGEGGKDGRHERGQLGQSVAPGAQEHHGERSAGQILLEA